MLQEECTKKGESVCQDMIMSSQSGMMKRTGIGKAIERRIGRATSEAMGNYCAQVHVHREKSKVTKIGRTGGEKGWQHLQTLHTTDNEGRRIIWCNDERRNEATASQARTRNWEIAAWRWSVCDMVEVATWAASERSCGNITALARGGNAHGPL